MWKEMSLELWSETKSGRAYQVLLSNLGLWGVFPQFIVQFLRVENEEIIYY